jgi:nucleotide-binding universal stress UspA family protein
MSEKDVAGDGAGSVIVVGIDGSEPAKDALRWAARQAELTGARLHLVISWYFPVTYGWGIPVPPEYSFRSDAEKILDETLDEVLGARRPDTLTTAVVEGHPALELVSAADAAGADLLVVGSRGHGAFTGMLLGSVSEHCVHHARCPVVVVRRARRDRDEAENASRKRGSHAPVG